MGSGFAPWDILAFKLTFKHTKIPYAICLGTIGIILKWFGDLEKIFANSELDMSSLCIKVVMMFEPRPNEIGLCILSQTCFVFSLTCP